MSEEQKANITVNLKEVPTTVEAGAQNQQIIDVECKNIFTVAPRMSMSF